MRDSLRTDGEKLCLLNGLMGTCGGMLDEGGVSSMKYSSDIPAP